MKGRGRAPAVDDLSTVSTRGGRGGWPGSQAKQQKLTACGTACVLAPAAPHVGPQSPSRQCSSQEPFVKPQMKRLPFCVQGFARFASYTFK